jgi:hypothetical protein
VFLVNSRFPLVCATPSSSGREGLHRNGVILLPKLRMYFAEFLNHSSPDRLGMLYHPTCVGLGYGRRANSLLGFSRQHGISDFSPKGSASRLRVMAQLSSDPPTRLPQDNQRLGSLILLRPPSVTRPQFVGSLDESSSPLVPEIGLGADTAVPEYQPVVHRLRLSASP